MIIMKTHFLLLPNSMDLKQQLCFFHKILSFMVLLMHLRFLFYLFFLFYFDYPFEINFIKLF